MRCFETIKVLDGKIFHIDYHNRRCNTTRKALFGATDTIDLQNFISPPPRGLYRCKVIYDTKIQNIEFFPYRPRVIKSLQPIRSDIDYPYKFLDRSALDRLFAQRKEADDILIIKDGLITDTSIANVALSYKGRWLTPAKPLLAGTTRARLLDQKKLILADIEIKDIKKFDKIALLNAMIGFYQLQEFTIKEF